MTNEGGGDGNPYSPTWLPFRLRAEGSDDYIGPHEGVPPWLMTSLLTWIEKTLQLVGESDNQRRAYVEQMERTLRRWALIGSQWPSDPVVDVIIHAQSSEECVLDVVDYILDTPPRRYGAWEAVASDPGAVFEDLEQILKEAGSVWTVKGGGGHVGLQRRMSEEMAKVSEHALGGLHPANQLLAEAWHDVFGRHPDPDDAYTTAIKAVEAAAKETIAPRDQDATLSKMAQAMLDKPSKWSVVIDSHNDGAIETLAWLLRHLMRGHKGRHGGGRRENVTEERAEAAVKISALMVELFQSGAVRSTDVSNDV